MEKDKKSQNWIKRAKNALIKRWQEKMSKGSKMFLVILSYLVSGIGGALVQIPIDKFILHREKVKLWSVSGCIKLEDREQFERENTFLSIKPPEQELYTDGQFVIYKVPIKVGEGGKPSLLIKKDGYKIVQVVLEKKPPDYYTKFFLKDY
jgi:hypothetical protein